MRIVVLMCLVALGCRKDDRDQEVAVIVCTRETVEVDAPRPMELTDDQGHACAVPAGHSSHERKGKTYRLVDGATTVARCE